MLDVIFTKGETVWIGGEEKNRNMVIDRYLRLNSEDIEHILNKFKEQRRYIKRLHKYLKTMLYNVKQEIDHCHTNITRVDGMAI